MRFTLVVLLALAARAQEFEVVSIKPGDTAFPGSSARSTAGGMEWRNTTVNNLIRGAYHLNEYQLTGGPKWADTERFNVDVKFPGHVARRRPVATNDAAHACRPLQARVSPRNQDASAVLAGGRERRTQGGAL